MRIQHVAMVIVSLLAIVASGALAAEGGKKVVVPFDFVSKFDDGRYGQMVGDMVWKKLQREGGFVLPESMLDVRDTVASNKIELAPDTPLAKVQKIVQEDFGADVAIWGSVERVPGNEWDVYDLKIRCVDFSTPKPTVIYQVDARTKAVSEIPHLYVKAMVDKLYGRQPGGPPPVNELAEANWKKNPNLVAGGDFETAKGGVPRGWESRGGQLREPLGSLVRWLPEAGNPANHVIRLTFDQELGDSFGVMYYSDFFPVEEGATYRFQCRWRTNGPAAKVFVKAYDVPPSEYRAEPEGRPAAASPTEPYAVDNRREVYRSQQNLKGEKNVWNTQTQDFTPRHTRYTPRWGRVMLYGFLGAGAVEFDDVVVKQIIPASPGERVKQPRQSLESGVTVEEMGENERRGKDEKTEPRP